ncbi:hypothetical protein PG993_005438 [Apiospora rasikravindrae]|uniref:Uncharacterized protein n=1 Tax=Apiospora rasikravindrae TaxID=990691 RepID=A0ABR1TFL2_9PEZI
MSYQTIQLHDVLPRAGFVIDNHSPFTCRPQRDKLIVVKLRQARVIGRAFLKRNEYRGTLNAALETMFIAAARDNVRAKLTKAANDDEDGGDDEGGYLDFVDEVKKHVEWAQQLSSSVFLDFFTALLGARVNWNNNPRQPLDPNNHSTTAKAAQALLGLEPGL